MDSFKSLADQSNTHRSNYSTTNLYAPNCPTMMTAPTAPLPPPTVLTIPPRPRAVMNKNIECANCGTKTTSAWRRNKDGESECNACNLFFRKNGRKRPASMRYDTIPRRYRRSRCSLRVEETDSNLMNFGQYKKSSSKSLIHQRNTFQPSDLNQSTSVQDFFVPANASCGQFELMPIRSNGHCSTHNLMNPVMLSYATERTPFSSINTEQQTPSKMNYHLSFTRRCRSSFLETRAFHNYVPSAPPNPAVNVMEHEPVNKKIALTEHITEDHQKQPCSSFIYPMQQKLVERNMFKEYQFSDQYSEAYSIINEECPSTSFLNNSSAADKYSFQFDAVNAGACGNATNESFSLVQDDCNEESGEGAPVYLSL
uniref:GATA-type domain-containing protein n=1 Tax=Angiostrongylus cantonensis TaxID=6313 RepID=A0A0K0D4W0_ANGCA